MVRAGSIEGPKKLSVEMRSGGGAHAESSDYLLFRSPD